MLFLDDINLLRLSQSQQPLKPLKIFFAYLFEWLWKARQTSYPHSIQNKFLFILLNSKVRTTLNIGTRYGSIHLFTYYIYGGCSLVLSIKKLDLWCYLLTLCQKSSHKKIMEHRTASKRFILNDTQTSQVNASLSSILKSISLNISSAKSA